ncbi:hypothetical protein MMC13_001292 [Lambiella insularis]|nr:hypothetical protein [Lambiella insularis]
MSAKTILIPWDPESADHVERLFQQRVACGWNMDLVEEWRVKQREGTKAIHWIVLPQSDPDRSSKIHKHIAQWPAEEKPLQDTAKSLQGVSRNASTSESFVPVGHISLDSENKDPTVANAAEHLYCIATFYISTALQGGGFGRAAMDTVEAMARRAPLNAKALALHTACRDEHYDHKWNGLTPPMVVVQDWYARRGYQVYKYEKGYYKDEDAAGVVWPITAVFMRKDLDLDAA